MQSHMCVCVYSTDFDMCVCMHLLGTSPLPASNFLTGGINSESDKRVFFRNRKGTLFSMNWQVIQCT